MAPRVELARYMGTWYEIASIPSFFQKGCVSTRVLYSLQPDGQVKVVNECRKESFEGDVSSITGKAWAPDPAVPARLKVQFFWPLSADYWIIDLDPAYQYAVVGQPGRERLWILSRTRQLDEKVYQTLLQNATRQGYDVSRLARTRQPKQ